MSDTPSPRIEALLAQMTLPEKIGQLTMLAAGFSVTGPVVGGDVSQSVREGRAGSLLNVFGPGAVREIQRVALEESRLKIPLLLGFDVVHGHRTVFPIPLGEAASFDPELWEETARVAAREAAADGVALTFAPMLDIARDPRWGRMAEGAGEDPLVAALYARAKLRGFQGSNLADPDRLAATAKHLVAYGAASAGRDYASTDVSERTLRETYLPPFEAALEEDCACIMPAFSDLSGVPMTANGALLGGWLRGEKGFRGVVVSDYNAVAELIPHGVAADLAEAASLALRAGVDIDMMSGGAYETGLPEALRRGLVTIDDIDRSVRRVLALKERLGLFRDPWRALARGDAGAGPQVSSHRALARQAAARSVVLLSQHDPAILPLPDRPMRIAVLGPLAEAPTDMMGSWSGAGEAEETVTILRGLREARPDCEIAYARGVGIDESEPDGFEPALALARGADLVVLALGESRAMTGEAASRTGLDLPGDQTNFARAVLALGRPTVALLAAGRPLTVPWLFDRAGAVLATWFGGTEAGSGVADVLTGRVSPSGRLPVTWPRAVGQVPIFFAERPGGRPPSDEHYTSKYIDLSPDPQFFFGHGLTYGRVVRENLRAEPAGAREDETVLVSLDLRNEGAHTAEETVFLFSRKPVARVARPRLELQGFARVSLAPGGHTRCTIPLPVSALAFPGPDLARSVERGEYEILVGPSADPATLLRTRIEVVGSAS
ncbi:glycoside hydrolase family 3 N-terminal domain-containing protein [Aureimonas sp. AU4]|uniref:glycoside hydrolase family 3 N-terminal domain-containing protein n=1 Tax=Aureimonas sp. AU4 TaxID=1638163 RepID=UPI0007839F4F|nr:glycoside hydrolase family 3 N-terminal domain-containing protein [Aureimonas sp. AU4]